MNWTKWNHWTALLRRHHSVALGLAWIACVAAAGAEEVAASPTDQRSTTLSVSTDFGGGSAELIEVDQQRRLVRLRPTAHKDRGWVCWWYFKLSGIESGETITVDVGDAPWATPDRAAFSTDNTTWQQTAIGHRQGRRIVYRQRVNSSQAWFAWGPPFVPDDAEKLVRWAAERCRQAEAFELCRTRADRPVPALVIDQTLKAEDQPYGVWIQARQHAWESGSCWVCRGLVEWLVSDDPRAASLRQSAKITIVPIMDIDNVALGAGGKNQSPRDHNRDWDSQPHWPSVAAAMRRIKQQAAQGRFDLFVDLHNPGPGSKAPFFFITPRHLLSGHGQRNLDRFLAASQAEITGPLAFRGEVRESGSDYDRAWRRISKNWVSLHSPPHVVSLTLETAWNTPHSTVEGYQSVGRQLGCAMERYFRTSPREID